MASRRSPSRTAAAPSAARTALKPTNPVLIAPPAVPMWAASATAMKAATNAITAWRQLLTSTPRKKNTPVRIAGANSVAPSASTSATTHFTSSTGHGPKSSLINSGRASAMNQMTQNVTMNGAARNGIGNHFPIATATTATTAASTITHTHSARSGS